jgi:hypothetical protein
MTSLLHHHFPDTDVTEEEAVSYIGDSGSRFLVTPWPVQSLFEGTAVLLVGAWAGVALSIHNVWGGLATLLFTAVAALIVAAPGAYTETHREYAARYYAALRVHGDAGVRAHPVALLVAAPVLCALAGAFGGLSGFHEATGTRVDWAIGGAIVGFVLACIRIRLARRD